MTAERPIDTYETWRGQALDAMREAFGEGIEPWFNNFENGIKGVGGPSGKMFFQVVISGLLKVHEEAQTDDK